MHDNNKLPGGSSSGRLPEQADGGQPAGQASVGKFTPKGGNSPEWLALRPYLEKLVQNLKQLDVDVGIALAFSGGMDSMVLLQICRQLGLEVLAVHCTGPQFSSGHSRQAVEWLQKQGIPHQIVEHNALSLPEVRRSDPRRCYYCKTQLINRLREAAGGRIVCDGTNASDLCGYRPGLQALAEAGVYSPFTAVMLTKPLLRRLAEILGLELPQSSGQNCLLTRFEYGVTLDEAQLRTIEEVEATLLPLLTQVCLAGEPARNLQYRLRYVAGEQAAQSSHAELHIEAERPLPAALMKYIHTALTEHGLKGAPILVMPSVSGYFDQKLPDK